MSRTFGSDGEVGGATAALRAFGEGRPRARVRAFAPEAVDRAANCDAQPNREAGRLGYALLAAP